MRTAASARACWERAVRFQENQLRQRKERYMNIERWVGAFGLSLFLVALNSIPYQVQRRCRQNARRVLTR
jgi:hypothetical protein